MWNYLFSENHPNVLHGLLRDIISTVQATWLEGLFSSLAYFLSSPVTKSHGVPLNKKKHHDKVNNWTTGFHS